MQLTSVLISCVLIAILCTDVVISRPTRSDEITHMEAMIKDTPSCMEGAENQTMAYGSWRLILNGDVSEKCLYLIDDRLIASEKSKSRRRRRNVMTHKFAIMEFCLVNPGACRRELARLQRERNGGRRRPVVIVIEK